MKTVLIVSNMTHPRQEYQNHLKYLEIDSILYVNTWWVELDDVI